MTRVLSVVGAAGGVGASVLTAGLAAQAARHGASVVAVDARPFGGGLDVVLGADMEPGVRWRDLADVTGALLGRETVQRLPFSERCAVLSFDREVPLVPTGEVLRGVIEGLRGVCDLIVVDAPRAGEVWEGEIAGLGDTAIAVTGTTVTALSGAASSVAHLDAVHDDLRLACRTDRTAVDLPETIASLLDVPLLGGVPTDSRVVAALMRGAPPPSKGSFARAVDGLLSCLSPLRMSA